MCPREWIDLRSDTVTKPTGEMRAAMAAAEVGDDVYGEDPTVNRLQELAAQRFEKEAALFVPSGTMGNQIAIHVHTRPGQEVITEGRSHILDYEMAAMACISGVIVRPIPTDSGIMAWEQIEAAIRPRIYYLAQTGLVALENTHNMAGGTVYAVEQVDEICEKARAVGLPVHMDGARVFNAAVALGTEVSRLCRGVDSVMFCLSKGLAAPVGSILVGSAAFIERARSARKMFGGGMRQAGVLAAAGLIALEKMTARLQEDHENARVLASKLMEVSPLDVDPGSVRTNIVIVGLARTGHSSSTMSALLKERGVLVGVVNPTTIRLLTHVDVSRADVLRAAEIFRGIL
ncbi:MAG: GntG family PLP-dependent aldolase [Acidobacteriota bacterium]